MELGPVLPSAPIHEPPPPNTKPWTAPPQPQTPPLRSPLSPPDWQGGPLGEHLTEGQLGEQPQPTAALPTQPALGALCVIPAWAAPARGVGKRGGQIRQLSRCG